MADHPVLVAVDWGTTRMRSWLLDRAGEPLREYRSDDGLIAAQAKGFSGVLEQHLTALSASEDAPVIICGMAGSRQGWIEVPYVDVPSRIGDILRGAAPVPDQRRDVRIVPGLAQRLAASPDVMRGEETQLAGAGLLKGRHLACMPGTHSKWVLVEEGRVAGFGTWPTGELYSVLSEHSMLRHSLGTAKSAVSADDPAFLDACDASLSGDGNPVSKLFSIRAGSLLSGLTLAGAAARLSGLLVGSEIASATARFASGDTPVALVASGALAELYRAAIDRLGIAVQSIDADEAVRAGLFEAARQNGMIGGASA